MTKFEIIHNYFNMLLDYYDIEYTVEPHYEIGYKWLFPEYPDGDIICCPGSYGVDRGCVESYRFPWDDDDVTALPPSEMIKYLLGEKTNHIQTYTTEEFLDCWNNLPV